MTEKRLRTALFVFRCTGSALCALALAAAVGLPHSVWAAMSALIVSQDRLDQTKASIAARLAGTAIGIGAACGTNLTLAPLGASVYPQMALAVTLCALLTHRFPQFRVSMWTCALLLVASAEQPGILAAGLGRGEEVMLGTLTGGAFHAAAEALLRVFKKAA